MKRILVVNQNYLGDVLFTTPALAALRARFPDAEIDVFLSERAAPLLVHNPAVTRTLIRPASESSRKRWAALWHVMGETRYDGCVIFHGTLLSALFATLRGIRTRWGFRTDGAGWLLTNAVAPQAPGEHFAEGFLRIVGGNAESRTEFVLTPEEREAAKKLLPAGSLVGMPVATTRPQKNWPEAHFIALARRLVSAGRTPILLGGPADAVLADRIVAAAPGAISLCGKTDVRGLAAVAAQLDAVVSADTGPLHVAVAVGTPTIALFGSTDPAETGPFRPTAPTRAFYDHLSCAPCRKRPTCEGRFDCMVGLTPESVFQAVQEQLGAVTTLPLAEASQ